MSIEQAAALLNVSGTFLTRQIEGGEISRHPAGSGGHLKRDDVLAYRERLDARARAALDAMTAEAEELGLYG